MNSHYEIVYLAPAQRDLQRLLDFLTANGVVSHRAQAIVGEIVKKLRLLCENPNMGFSIGGKYGFETPYRGLICGKYIAVYETIQYRADASGRIEVRRVYHMREDYLSQLRALGESEL